MAEKNVVLGRKMDKVATALVILLVVGLGLAAWKIYDSNKKATDANNHVGNAAEVKVAPKPKVVKPVETPVKPAE